VATFDVMGGITTGEAQVVTELFMAELVSKGSVNVVDRVNFDKIIAEQKFQTGDWSNPQKTAALGQALNAGYVIRGQLMKMGAVIYWTATMIDIKTAQVLYSAREQVGNLGEVFGKLPAFCAQILDKIPEPNYFVGTWNSGGILRSPRDGFWRSEKYIKPYGNVSQETDDAVKSVIMYDQGGCVIIKGDGEKIEGIYAYAYNKPYFSLTAGDYHIEGQLFLNDLKTQFYVLYRMIVGSDYPYAGYFKSFIKTGR
jgi:TolB-like protein